MRDPHNTTTPAEGHDPAGHGFMLVFCSFGLNGLLYGSLLSRYAEIADAVRADEAVFGLVLAAGAVGGLVGSLVAPLLVRTVGDAGAAAVFGCTFALLACSVAGAPTLVVLAIALFVMTVVDGGQDVAMNALAVRVQQRTGRPIMGRAHAAWSVSLAAGTGVGAAAASLQVPVLGHIAAVAAVLVAAQLGAWWTYSPRTEPVSRAESHSPSNEDDQAAGRWLTRGRARVLIVMLAAAAVAASYVESPGQEWTALLLSRGFDTSAGLAASAPLAFSIGLVASRLVLDRLTDRLGRSLIAMISGGTTTAAMVAGLLVGVLDGPVWLVLAALALAGIGAGPVFPLLFGAADILSSRYGVRPDTTASVVSACSRTGAISAPVIVGALTGATSLLAVLVVMAAGGLAIMLMLPHTLRNHHDRSPSPSGEEPPGVDPQRRTSNARTRS